MADSITQERAKRDVINCCATLIEDILKTHAHSSRVQLHLALKPVGYYRGIPRPTPAEEWEIIVFPKGIPYNTPGELTGEIKGYDVSVFQYRQGRFKTWINGQERKSLSRKFVEENLGISVRKKRSGPQAGQHSETNSKPVWHHLADRHKGGDMTVFYEPPAYRVVIG
jgi:hypothetical protein